MYNGRLVEASKKLKPWRAAVAEAVERTFIATGDRTMFTGPVVVRAVFYLPKPKSVKRFLPTVPPDIDKLQRALGDAMSVDTQLIQDDSLIVSWLPAKVYATNPEDSGVRVAIRSVDIENDKDQLAAIEAAWSKLTTKWQ